MRNWAENDRLTVGEAAREKGRHPSTVRRAIREGRLPAEVRGWIYLIRWGDLKDWQPRERRR